MADTASTAGTVLLVDDERTVVRIGRVALERAGFRVATASDGLEALALIERLGEGVSVVVLDVSMPRLGGDALLERIRRERPGLPVVISSGFDDPPVVPDPADDCVTAVLPKPYRPSELVACVREVLEADAPLRSSRKRRGTARRSGARTDTAID